MILGYARVSTLDQNVDLQRDALAKAGAERIFEDKISGALKAADRPALAECLSHLREGDTLVVWKLDRLGRSIGGLIELVGELRERKVEFRSITDGIDTSTPAGRFMFHVLAALAEMERDLIRERTRAGLAAARARGRAGGRRKSLSADQVRLARHMMNGGGSVDEIARTFRVSRATLYRSVKEEAA